ncbi:hypothetical protein Pcinc_012491 [Petrolisthes cinctipes]|uniref:Uncharacterized protein n=1 Tax=Petrolisthes cinctipes TaxID=88211 RepID=A0AAE1G1N0_PETCI|nr:hypothetical protein Pcinc_012491 [Petrolisthes cinctipes]
MIGGRVDGDNGVSDGVGVGDDGEGSNTKMDVKKEIDMIGGTELMMMRDDGTVAVMDNVVMNGLADRREVTADLATKNGWYLMLGYENWEEGKRREEIGITGKRRKRKKREVKGRELQQTEEKEELVRD